MSNDDTVLDRIPMYDNNQLCEKIRSVFPDIGKCGIDLKLDFDDEKKAWIVDLTKGSHHLQTHLEPEDANICMEGRQCVGLAMQIGQLRGNIDSV